MRTLVRMELELFRQRVLSGASLPDLPLGEVTRDATDLAERLICAMRNKLVVPELESLTAPPAPATAPARKPRAGKRAGSKKRTR